MNAIFSYLKVFVLELKFVGLDNLSQMISFISLQEFSDSVCWNELNTLSEV